MVKLFQVHDISKTYKPERMISALLANSCSLHACFTKTDVSRPSHACLAKADISRPRCLPVTRRSDLQNTCLKALDVERHSGRSLAAALLATVLLASPAFAKAPSSEYISVQDRVRQRAPLQRKQSGYNTSSDAAPDLQAKMPSVLQQAGQSCSSLSSTACRGTLYPKSVLTYR